MTKRPFMFLCAAVAALGFSAAAQAQPQKATGVAVVEVQKAFDALSEKTQVEGELQSATDVIKSEDNKRVQKIQSLGEDLKLLVAGTPPHVLKQEEQERAVLDRQAWLQYQQTKLNRERALRIEAIYKKMLETIGRVATADGYKLVLYKEPDVSLSQLNKPEQISAVIGSRKVLWSAADLDLTDRVIQVMNNDFKSGKPPK